ncbi:MAG: PIN domain-containing protein [Candidatus Methylomirabilales bacterium]
MVIADTSVWIEYFTGAHPSVRAALRTLIRSEQAVLVGVVLAELLQGCRTRKETDTILSTLTGLRFLATNFTSWRRTGELASSLRRKGITLPLSDLIIAAVALEHECQVFTLDTHFRQIPGVKVYRWPRPRKPR